MSDCSGELIDSLQWFSAGTSVALAGTLEFGQTHVTGVDDPRIVPPLVQQRETLILFTPDTPLVAGTDLRIAAFKEGTLLGVIQANPPEALPQSLEQLYTQVTLDPYSTTAWSGFLPWNWLREGVKLHVGYVSGGALREKTHAFSGLGAPHRITLSRGKIILFGKDDELDSAFLKRGTLAQDMFATMPIAEMRVVDSTPWEPDYVVVASSAGPTRVSSVGEYAAATDGADRWPILKNQFALRMSSSNTGRGLWRTEAGTDSSPYSFGTSMGMGWVKNDDGTYSDANNAPHYAGWTGWNAMGLSQCSNFTIHELGHSFTMHHFEGGKAAAWGIADEYPSDGVNLVTHPWGFDTTRRLFRTWYRVESSGIATHADGSYVGKRDPLNGGESANAVTCFPQYTAYHSRKIQHWSEGVPTILELNGSPGVFKWNKNTHKYDIHAPEDYGQQPTGVDVPTVTLIGTLASTAEGAQIYPPFYWASGNVFELPDPGAASLPSVYQGGQYFLEVRYEGGGLKRALIARKEITDNSLGIFSVNLPSDSRPVEVRLYLSPTGYPNIDVAGAVLKHTRTLSPPSEPLSPVVRIGRERVANGPLKLTISCVKGIDCEGRVETSTWRIGANPLTFTRPGEASAPGRCKKRGAHTRLVVPAVKDGGIPASLVVHAQRVIQAGDGSEVAVPLNDSTRWVNSPDVVQGLRVWIPYEKNKSLPSGHYTANGDYKIEGWREGGLFSSTPIQVDFEVRDIIQANLTNGYKTPTLPNEPSSSSYFIVEDPSMGPTGRKWWSGGDNNLYAPVVDEQSGTLHTLRIFARKVACGDWWDFNTGQDKRNCEYHANLSVNAGDNPWLVSGRTYRSPPSSPLVIIAQRWHKPGARRVTGVFPLRVIYTAP